MGIEVAIPLLSGIELARQLVLDSMTFSGVDSIHLSINDPGENPEPYLQLQELDPRVRVSVQKRNLGLYGNFRYLVQQSKSEFIHWHCFDDCLSSETLYQATTTLRENGKIALGIIPFVRRECRLQPLRWDEKSEPGNLPMFTERSDRFNSALFADPSWIFGVWRTSSLHRLLPRRDFDWLDVALLQKTILRNQVAVCVVDQPLTIGTWNWANKVANAVNGRFHRPWQSILRQGYDLLVHGYFWSNKNTLTFLVEARGRLRLAVSLSEKLADKR